MNKNKFAFKIGALVLALMVLLSASGCSSALDALGLSSKDTTEVGTYPVSVAGAELDAQPQKVLVLSASVADIIVELGYSTNIVAASEDCAQAELETIQKVSSIDDSTISQLSCDLIIVDADYSGVDALVATGVPVAQIEPAKSREDYERLFGEVGTLMGGEGVGYDSAVKAAKEIFKLLDDISREASSDIITTACYLYDIEGKAVTGDMFGTVIMEYSGLTNAFTSLSGGEYDISTLKIQNPGVIFCAPGVKEQIESSSDFAGLQAVADGKVYELDESYFSLQGRTVVTCALSMVDKAFPELKEEVSAEANDPTKEIDSAVEDSYSTDEDASYNTLQEYDSGDEVMKLQERLSELGYLDADFDGLYGSYTVQAVKDFQSANDLEVTGTADPTTQRVVFSNGAVANAAAENSESSDGSESSDSSESSESSSENDGTEE